MAKAPSRYWIDCNLAASILDVDPATVRNWLKRALAGDPIYLRRAKIHSSQYFASRKEVKNLAARHK